MRRQKMRVIVCCSLAVLLSLAVVVGLIYLMYYSPHH